MEIEHIKTDRERKLSSGTLKYKAKTSLRMRYEAEAQIILRKFGGLKGLQEKMGLNQRKICQLLMVDPSSWSRWLSNETKVPPHILRACEWYLAVNDKYPGFDVNFWLHSNSKYSEEIFVKTQHLQKELKSDSSEIRNQVSTIAMNMSQLSSNLARAVKSKTPILRWLFIGLVLGLSLSWLFGSIVGHFATIIFSK